MVCVQTLYVQEAICLDSNPITLCQKLFYLAGALLRDIGSLPLQKLLASTQSYAFCLNTTDNDSNILG